ncbi:MAG: PDZ domain-containing protein [Ruminococcaceae bacterium]|nr:PDZ domain-containing protein [Oscillospiraceae bacterium]
MRRRWHEKQKTQKAALKAKNMTKIKKVATVFLTAVFFTVIIINFSAAYALSENSAEAAFRAVSEEKILIAAGVPFGVRLHTDGVIVVNLTAVGTGENAKYPSREAGLHKGDVIISVNGERVGSAKALCDAVSRSEGKELSLTVKHEGRDKNISVCPQKDGEVYKIGVLVRDNAAGIGTVTFIDPATGMFAGLGHGICDSETGELIPISYGSCEDVTLTDIIKGKSGAPGELRGFFSGKKTGKIIGNSFAGVFGALSSVPSELSAEQFPACGRGYAHNGKAYIYTTVDGEGRQKYEVSISAIDEGGAQKNFIVEVTDETLLSKTGGIVQGMSGSPIIQDGKLIGAVTHVLVGDPSRGYGIFIENMLAAAG